MTRTQIGRWRLGEVLGEGGMGTVFLAHHQTLEIAAAAKILSPKLSRDPKFRERFLREARAQAQFRHPGIAQVMDFIEEGEDLCIVVEYLAGGTLEKRLVEGKPLPLETALAWARQALEALDRAHQRGIIHRDIKPSNIMLDELGHAKIVDFGIALVLDGRRLTTATGSLGTPHYMSPEQIRRPQEVDHRTDVYSMGVVLYEMLAGRPPFDADSEFDVQAAQVNDPPKPLRELNPDVPEEIAAVVLKALEKDPDARHAGCGEFARALEAVQEKKAETVEPPPLPPPLPPRKETSAPRFGWLAACLGALAVIAFVVLIVKINELKDEREVRRATETTLQDTEARAQTLHELVAAKSWPLVTGTNFDYFSKYNSTVFHENELDSRGKGRRSMTFLTYQWRLEAREGFIWIDPGDGTMQKEGELIYSSVEIKIGGSDRAFGGLVFRRREDSSYLFRISRDSYSVVRESPESWKSFQDWGWTASNKIRAVGYNRLAVIAEGERIRLFINDENIGEFEDSSLGSGEVGVAVGFTEAGQSATLDFDNFELRKRPSGG